MNLFPYFPNFYSKFVDYTLLAQVFHPQSSESPVDSMVNPLVFPKSRHLFGNSYARHSIRRGKSHFRTMNSHRADQVSDACLGQARLRKKWGQKLSKVPARSLYLHALADFRPCRPRSNLGRAWHRPAPSPPRPQRWACHCPLQAASPDQWEAHPAAECSSALPQRQRRHDQR